MAERAVVLLSGGLDSVTVLAVARSRGLRVSALSFDYGQRHRVELECARSQATKFQAEAHEVIDLGHFGRLVAPATALLQRSAAKVPKARDLGSADDVPVTYVPARNTVFLSYALAWAEAIEAGQIFIGVNALDYSGYPDCRPEFIAAFERVANLATRAGTTPGSAVSIKAPLQDLRKSEIVALGTRLGVDFANTVSCYDPTADDAGRPLACATCDSCQLRAEGFKLAGIADPTRYVP